MNTRRLTLDLPARQRGAALIVSLILIFVVSILGITSMERSIMERQLATNAVQSNLVFQAAESATDSVINNPTTLMQAFSSDTNSTKVVLNLEGQDDLSIGAEADLTFLGNSVVRGYSIGLFEGLRFEARGDGSFNGAKATVEQGAVRVVPTVN